jgi:hypothetical protein
MQCKPATTLTATNPMSRKSISIRHKIADLLSSVTASRGKLNPRRTTLVNCVVGQRWMEHANETPTPPRS